MVSQCARRAALALGLALVTVATLSTGALAQYVQTNLTATVSKAVPNHDPNLVNGWGLAFFPQSPFWISDNGTGKSTLYNHTGSPLPLVVTIPAAPSLPEGTVGSPTGIIANPTPDFVVSENNVSGPALFIFDSLDGTISGWNPNVDLTHAVIAVDNSSSGAVYTGLAFAKTQNHTLIYAADTANNKVDVYDGGFHWIKSFTDPKAPAGLSVYGIQNINGKLYVTFGALGVPGGAVDVFSTNGQLLRRLASNGMEGPLQSPWGTAVAPSDFGQFSNALLVGNVADGHISAFDPKSGMFMGQVKDMRGKLITIRGLWALQFGLGGAANGATNQLFFSAGPDNYSRGLFGMITAADSSARKK